MLTSKVGDEKIGSDQSQRSHRYERFNLSACAKYQVGRQGLCCSARYMSLLLPQRVGGEDWSRALDDAGSQELNTAHKDLEKSYDPEVIGELEGFWVCSRGSRSRQSRCELLCTDAGSLPGKFPSGE